MATRRTIGNEVSVDAQAFEREPSERDEDDFELADEPALRPSVEQEIQAKVDANHPDARPAGLSLAAEERLDAREREIERTRERGDRRADSDREARTRRAAARGSRERRRRVMERAASVDARVAPERADPRERLSRQELAAVHREAARLVEAVEGWTRAAIARRLAERVAAGAELASAVVALSEALATAPGTIVPIGKLEAVQRGEVSVAGRVETLWEPSHAAIQQVGLVADETGRTKVTVWKASRQPWMRAGERVRIWGARKNWYQGRVSIAVVGRTRLAFPERGRWWAE